MEDNRQVAEFTDERVEALRREVEELKQDPRFAELSKAFRRTLAERTGATSLGGAGPSITGAAPVPLKQVLEKIDLTLPGNMQKLEGITVTLGEIAKAAGLDDVKALSADAPVTLDPSKLGVVFDFGEGGHYYNIYNYRFW